MESWSYIRIFHSGDDYYHNLVQDIRNAQHSITIESYIFAIDKLTETVLNELSAARNRGCIVKIVVDGFGSYTHIPSLDRQCKLRGIEMRVFHPFPYPLFLVRKKISEFSTSLGFFLKHFNRRNHRKITIIDEKRAYLGSLNFTQDHCESLVGPKAWRDTGVCVEGPEIKQLVLDFKITYMRTYVKGLFNWVGHWTKNTNPKRSLLRLNTTQRMRRRLYKDLLARVNKAESRIYLTTAYFLPKRSLLRTLFRASQRGVDIKIIIPGKSDVPMVKWAAFNIMRFLIKKGLPIFEYQPRILHAKTMIIDNEAFIGSFNMNHRSIMHDLEVEIILQDPESLSNMLSQWQEDLKNSKQLSSRDLSPPSFIFRILHNIAFRLRYML